MSRSNVGIHLKFIQGEGVRLGVPGNDSVCQGSGVDCSDVCVFEWGLG